MKRFTGIGVFVLSGVLSLLGASAAHAEWHQDYHEAKAAAIEAGQRLLVVLEQPGDAQHSVQQVSTTASPAETELLKPYVTCRVDVTTEKGKKLATAFGATEFPFTAIIDRNGRFVVYSNTGHYTDAEWASMLAENKEAKRAAVADENCFT